MGKIRPNIAFKNTVEALDYYKKVFKATNIMRVPLMPEIAKQMKLTPAQAKKATMHASFDIDGSTILAFDEANLRTKNLGKLGDVMSLCLDYNADEKGEPAKMKKLYESIAKDKSTKILMPLAKQPWGGEMAKVIDKYGIVWVLHSMSYSAH